MSETFANSPTRAIAAPTIRDLWQVRVQYDLSPASDGDVLLDPTETIAVLYTVKKVTVGAAIESALADIYGQHHEGDVVTVTSVTAELLPPVLK